MDNNEFTRRVRYALQIDDAEAARLMLLGGKPASAEQAAAWRQRDDEAGYLPCTDVAVQALLDGLIADRRSSAGTLSVESAEAPSVWPERRSAPARASVPLHRPSAAPKGHATDNNTRLKQLRIALALRSDAVQNIMTAGGAQVGSSEVAALFRKPGTRNFRRCGDQLLRQFINGLASRRDE